VMTIRTSLSFNPLRVGELPRFQVTGPAVIELATACLHGVPSALIGAAEFRYS
jgi:hypothetical protein